MGMTQQEALLRYIEDCGSITSFEAFQELGITRLASVVYNLKKKGYDFDTEDITVKNRYGQHVTFARYRLR